MSVIWMEAFRRLGKTAAAGQRSAAGVGRSKRSLALIGAPFGLAGPGSRRWNEGEGPVLGLLPSRSRSGIKPLEDSLFIPFSPGDLAGAKPARITAFCVWEERRSSTRKNETNGFK